MPYENRSLTFVYGSDDFLVDRRSRVIFDSLRDGGGEIFVLDTETEIHHALAALSTVPLFAGDDVIWLRSVRPLAEAPISDAGKELSTTLVEAILAATDRKIILSAAPVDRRTKAFKELSQASTTIVVGGEGDTIGDALVEFIAENAVTIDGDALRLLRMKCGSNARLLEREIEKLATHVGRGGNITAGTVSFLVEDQDPGNFFEPVEKFFDGDVPATLRAIDGYFFSNGDGRPLLAALQSRTRTLIQLHAILDAGILHGGTHGISKNNMENAAKIFSANTVARGGFNVFSQNPWYLSRLMATCEEFTLAELLTFQSLFFSAFLKIAVNYQDQATALKELAIRCLCDHSSR